MTAKGKKLSSEARAKLMAALAKPRLAGPEFVRTWQTAATFAEFIEKTKLGKASAQTRARQYRKKGVKLKVLPGERAQATTEELIALADELAPEEDEPAPQQVAAEPVEDADGEEERNVDLPRGEAGRRARKRNMMERMKYSTAPELLCVLCKERIPREKTREHAWRVHKKAIDRLQDMYFVPGGLAATALEGGRV